MASSKKVRGLLVEIGGDTSKLQKALKDVDSSTNKLGRELNGINSMLKFDPSNTTLLNQKTKVLSETIEEVSKRLEALKQAQNALDSQGVDKTSEGYRDLEREIIQTTKKLSELQNENSKWKKASTELLDYGSNLSKLGKEIESVGNKLTVGLTLPVAALGSYFIKSSKDFESAFAGVRKTVNATEEEYSKLKNEIISLSKELPATANEIAAVTEAAGQLGIQNDSLIGFTKTMINLGEATNLSAEEAATSLARFANITRMNQKDFDKLGSVITDLGNNFATTETEIVEMALRLAGAGKQIKLSEAEILSFAAALSSVGIEAEAGGSAFSKVMINMQLAVEKGGKKLQDFASVAGMSVSEFQKLFTEDAASAIISFINGLSNLDGTGQTAISVLDEMGISEVRLRDSLLRASSASEVFSYSIDLGTNAWRENIALTKEAEQRYKTSESQWEIAKNKATALAISFGEKLLPHVNKLMDGIGELLDKFGELSDEEQATILKTMAFLATLGPVTKTVGTVTKVLGIGTKTLGKFAKAIGEIKTGTTSASKAVNIFSSGIKLLSNPVGMFIGVVGGAAASTAYFGKKMKENYEEAHKLESSIRQLSTARKEFNQNQFNQSGILIAEINNTSLLVDELKRLTDANGIVKAGYEGRVSYILGELNSALGTEYSMTGSLINNYQSLVGEIDNLILKKKAKVILDAQEKIYEEALKNKDAAYAKQAEALTNLNAAQAEYNKKQKELNEYIREYGEDPLDKRYLELSSALNGASVKLREQTETYNSAKAVADSYYKDIVTYETNAALALEGSTDSLNKIIASQSESYIENGKVITTEIDNQIQRQMLATQKAEEELKKQSSNIDKYRKEVVEKEAANARKQLDILISNLISQTSTINDNSPEVIEAWKTLGINSADKYREVLKTLPNELKNTIVSMTGIPYSETENIRTSFGYLGSVANESFSNFIGPIPETARKAIDDTNEVIISKTPEISSSTGKLATEATNKFNVNTFVFGKNWVTGLDAGLKDASAKNQLMNSAGILASAVIGVFTKSWDIHSPAKKAAWLTKNFDLGLVAGIDNNKSVVLDSAKKLSADMVDVFDKNYNLSNFDNFQGTLSQKITDATRTVFTTPNINFYVQKMDEANLDAAFRYVNNKFGSSY